MLSRLLAQLHEILAVDDVALSRDGRYYSEFDCFFQNGRVLGENVAICQLVYFEKF